MLFSSTSMALLPKQTLPTVRLMETCPILPSDLEVIKGTWRHIFPMGEIHADERRRVHSHCLSCFMQDSLYQNTSGNAYWIERGKSHQREKSTLWILIGLGQIFCEVKFKIAADLSIKIKKITRNVFWGQFFFSLLNFQSNYLAVPSTIIISISQDFFFPQGDTSTSFHGKGRDVLCNLTQFWSIWDKDSSRDLVIMGFLLSIRCYGCPSSPLQTYL